MDEGKILIVEDEALLAVDLKSQLEELGYSVCGIAPSSAKAMQLVESEMPALILMDISIKGEVDGIDTARMIREKHDIPVVFLTAYADEVFLNRAKLAEPFGYLIKPVEIRELHSNIEIACYKAKMEKERETLIKKLEDALAEIKTLRGLLPICSFCKQIRNDEGCWQQLESYISAHSDAEFSHGICPACLEKEYPFIIKEMLEERD